MTAGTILIIGIPIIIGAIIAALFHVQADKSNRKFEARIVAKTESTIKSTIEDKFDKLARTAYLDGIPQTKDKEKQRLFESAIDAAKALDYRLAIVKLGDFDSLPLKPKERFAVLNLLASYHAEIKEYDSAFLILAEMYAYASRAQDNDLLAIYYMNYGWCTGITGRRQEALRAYNEIVRLKPDFVEAWYGKGVALAELGQHQEAIEALNKAVELKPDYAEAWNNRGLEHIKLGQYQEAIRALNRAIELKPNDAEAWNNKGALLSSLKRHQEAHEALNRAIELKPNDAEAWNNKGVLFAKSGQYQEALRAFEKGIELKPDMAGAWYNKAHAYSILKEKAGSVEGLRKAIQLDTNNCNKAKTDEDFRWLWDDEDFRRLTEG